MVVDNNYLYPTVTDRTFPPSPMDPTGSLQFVLTDSLDQLTGHELGHALSLDHRANNAALMNPGATDNDGDGDVDNIALNSTEISALRANALGVPGLETDPPGKFTPGRYLATRMVDRTRERNDLPGYLDLASVKVTLDSVSGEVTIGQQLFGLLPKDGNPVEFWYLIDTDGAVIGANQVQLEGIREEAPTSRFRGADLIIRAVVAERKITATAWRVLDGKVAQVDRVVIPELHTLMMRPHFAQLSGPGGKLPPDEALPVHHIVTVKFPGRRFGLQIGKEFRVQTMLGLPGGQFIDRLDDTAEELGVKFLLDHPSFPHCYPEGEGIPGQIVKIRLENLRRNAPIHGLLGPDLVFRGTTDENAGGVIDFPIPEDTKEGFHLVTIGVDRTALTADCVIFVRGKQDGITFDRFSLLKSHEDLLRGQQRLIEKFGALIEHLQKDTDAPWRELLPLLQNYNRLVSDQAKLLEKLGELVTEVK